MRPNIPTMLQTDYFETSHADLLLAAVIGEAPKPVGKMEAITAIIRYIWNGETASHDSTAEPEAAELCPICLITPLVGSDCPRCGDDCDFC